MSDYGAPPPPPMPGPAMGGQPPSNNLVLAIVSVFFCWPLAIPAIIFATQVNTKWAQGDFAGAQEASRKAKQFGMWGTIVGVVFWVLYAILMAVGFGLAASAGV